MGIWLMFIGSLLAALIAGWIIGYIVDEIKTGDW